MKAILLIEDNEDIRENTAEILELAGYKSLTAANGMEGVAAAIQHKPDLIICDIMMPELDGYGVLHMLQKNPATQSIPFIFLTAKAERTEMRRGMEMGADDYITKPFTGTELLSAIESRLKKVEMLRLDVAPGISGMDTLLSATHKETMSSLAEDKTINRFRKKQLIYGEGNNPHRLFYLQKGKVKTFKTNSDGKELVVNLYNEGDFFGYLALLEGTMYKESAEAIEDCEVALIPKQDFERLINND